ncbi:MAG: GNAT family N-acetyltransferase [Phycisphaerales bacterium JB043]
MTHQQASSGTQRDVRVLEDPSAIEALRERWNDLLSTSGECVPNVDIDRFLTTTRSLDGASPCVIAIGQGDELCALVIGRLWRERMRFRVGYVQIPTTRLTRFDVVYRGVVVWDPSLGHAVLGEIDRIARSHRWDVVQCSHLDDAQADGFRERFGRALRTRPDEEHWVWEFVEGSYDETLNTFSRKHRANVRRYNRVLEKAYDHEVEVRRYTRPDQIDEFIPLAASITKQSYHHAIGAGIRDTELWRTMTTMEAQKGRMRASVMFAKGEPIAYQHGCLYGSTFFLEAMTYDQRHRDTRPGAVLLQRTVEWLCEEGGVDTLDYGFGDAGYKKIHGTRSWNERTARIYLGSARARLASWLDATTAWIVARFRRTRSSDGSLGSLKRRWREFLRQRTEHRSG